jgi:hypothetical protein
MIFFEIVTVHRAANPMRFKPPECKHLQGAADARRRVRRRTFALQVPDNKADAAPCERLPIYKSNLDYRDFKVKILDCVKGRRRITLQPYPSGLAKNLVLNPITAGSGRTGQYKWLKVSSEHR